MPSSSIGSLKVSTHHFVMHFTELTVLCMVKDTNRLPLPTQTQADNQSISGITHRSVSISLHLSCERYRYFCRENQRRTVASRNQTAHTCSGSGSVSAGQGYVCRGDMSQYSVQGQ